MDLVIRKEEPGDGDAIGRILGEATAELRRVYRSRAGYIQQDEQSHWQRWIAVSGGLVVGTMEVSLSNQVLRVRALAVGRDRRGSGVARALLGHARKLAEEGEARRVELRTIRETGNETVFRRLGFVVRHEAPSQRFEAVDGGGVTEVVMGRTFQQDT